jgi:hypothetical protein
MAGAFETWARGAVMGCTGGLEGGCATAGRGQRRHCAAYEARVR